MKKTKKISFSTSIPAIIDHVYPSKTKHTTMAKLKVFYKGITGDGRRFSEDFSQKLLKSLPETPIVAFYNDEDDDFEGHAERQGVFGYVPENAQVYFQEIEGQDWAVTDVKLFTERDDVGRIAKKIVGKQHSLELNPETIDFQFAESEEDDYFITFLDGDLIGLSVLGDNQTPAFTGSGFFSSETKTPISLDEIISRYIALPKEIEVSQYGGETVFLDFVNGLFTGSKIQTVLENDYFLIYKVDGKVFITMSGEDNAPINVDITQAFAEEAPATEEEVVEETPEATDPVEQVQEEAAAAQEAAAAEEVNVPSDEPNLEPEAPKEVEGVEENIEQEQAEQPQPQSVEEGVEPQAAESFSDTAALNEAEREELENYRRKDKEGLISKYTNYLTAEQIKDFKNRIDSYSVKELDRDLSYEAMQRVIVKQEDEDLSVDNAFTRSFVGNGKSEPKMDELDATVKNILKR